MTDLELAQKALSGHTIALCKNGELLISDRRGIAPMMEFILSGKDLNGYCVADRVVGKAAAMLFVKSGILEVYAKTLSESAKRYLEAHDIPVLFEVLTEKIINRVGTDVCPMEKTVKEIEDAEEGYIALKNKLAELQNR